VEIEEGDRFATVSTRLLAAKNIIAADKQQSLNFGFLTTLDI